MQWRSGLLGAVVVMALGCSGSDDPDASYVEAFSHVANETKEAEAKVHAREHMEALRDKAEAEAAQAREAAFAAVVTVPDTLPRDLATACKDVAAAFDAFKTPRVEPEEAPRWAAVKSRDIDKIEAHCVELGDLRVAACQGHALHAAGSQFAADDGTKLLAACEDKLTSS